jgi:hypothetical protein
MARQFPYLAALTVTAVAGTVTTVWAAQVPVVHVVPPVVARVSTVQVSPVVPLNSPVAPGNLTNTPTSPAPRFPTGNPAVEVGAEGAPALVRAGAYGQAGMNQPGQAPFSEHFVSQQTQLNQPGQPDFFEGTTNPNVVQANQGVTPAQSYPNPTTPQTGVSTAAVQSFGFATTQGNNVVGFYQGFGPGQQNFGFYKGFTAPPQ